MINLIDKLIEMMNMKEIILYHSRICMKCISARRLLSEIKEEYPETKITKVGALSKLIMTREIRTIPAIEIGGEFLYGKDITKEKILGMLGI